ncbi:PP2C family protein-serine/threonine phosphatase [Nocardiopsis sp. N85]|nr:PP2C family protein-serine/threonine phosphatase [Nocardiopsis sp. N85]MDE3721133.1 PP2C family protein-serine/threonine phosphatase [Nocardiopsis sp. N85]
MSVVRASLARDHGAVSAELYLADYGLKTLCRVEGLPEEEGRDHSVFNTVIGRVFGSQEVFAEEPTEDGTRAVHLPVTARGERLGVLTVRTRPGTRVRAVLPDLVDTAGALGHELLVAGRHTDLYRAFRRRERLTLAAEIQWDLLPGRGYECAEYVIGAQLEPAYDVRGDNFDWSVMPDRLEIGVTNGMGEGIDASLLTNLAVNALRNARRGGISLADQAALADKAVYALHRGKRHVDMLLLGFDLDTGRVEVVDAGSPRLYLLRGDRVTRVPFDAQLPLGMAEDTVYVAQRFQVEPGDRLVFASDGVFDAVGPSGPEAFGDRALARAILGTRLLPGASVPQEVLRHLVEHQGGRESEDDALVVCVDWRGRP